MIPSQPPDMTKATRSSISAFARPVFSLSKSRKALCASGREKSLTRPFPSVLAMMQMTSSARSSPFSSSASSCETSSGPDIGTLYPVQW
jgi:hypothetical protein